MSYPCHTTAFICSQWPLYLMENQKLAYKLACLISVFLQVSIDHKSRCHHICVELENTHRYMHMAAKEFFLLHWIPRVWALSKEKHFNQWTDQWLYCLLPSSFLLFSCTACTEMGKDSVCDSYSLTSRYIENWNLTSLVITMIKFPVELVGWAPNTIPQACQITASICLWKAVLIKRGNYNIKCQALVCKLLSHRY